MKTNRGKRPKKHFFLEVHDFGFLLPGLDDILRLKEIYKDFKITCFTIPFPKEFFAKENQKHFKTDKYKKWAKIINSYDWMEIAVHGFAHTAREMDTSYDKAIITIKAFENLFEEIGLEYKKIFVAPYWQYSYDAFVALRDRGYAVGYDKHHPRPLPKNTKSFTYNWSFEELYLPSRELVVGHGHTTGRGVRNGLEQCYINILNKIPLDAKFGFISEFIEIEEKIKQQYAKENKQKATSAD